MDRKKSSLHPLIVFSLILGLMGSMLNMTMVKAMYAPASAPVTFYDDFSTYGIGSLGEPTWGNYVVSGNYPGQTAGIETNPISGGKGFKFYENCTIWGMCYQSVDFLEYQGLTDFSFSVKVMKTLDTRDIACGQPAIIVPLVDGVGEYRFNISWGYYAEGIFYCEEGSCSQVAGIGTGTVPGKSLNTWYSMEIAFSGQMITIIYDKGTPSERQYSGNHDKASFVKDRITLKHEVCGSKQQESYYDDFSFFAEGVSSSLIATTAASEVYPGDPVSVALGVQNADDLYAAQATCTVNPSVLELQSGTFGDFFDPVNRLIGANQADAVSGTWLGAISQRSPALPLSGDGLFATLSYTATTPGTTAISCDPMLSDQDGFTQTVIYSGTTITVLPFAIINGVVTYQGRLSHDGITITAAGPVFRIALADGTGNFTLDSLRAGGYAITADAPLYLPTCTTASVTSGQTLTLPTAILRGGDVNDDGVINIGDATLVAANFGQQVPPADSRADINADNIVNIRDLAILGRNYGLIGCQGW